MKYYLFILFAGLFLTVSASNTTEENDKKKAVAVIKNGKAVLNKSLLSTKSAGGYKVTGYKLIWSKNKKYYYLIQTYKHPKSEVNRFIPLEEEDNTLYVDSEPDGDWIDCWLMECSTCEQVISGSGAVWCECSVGGCAQADTSEPWNEVAEKLFR